MDSKCFLSQPIFDALKQWQHAKGKEPLGNDLFFKYPVSSFRKYSFDIPQVFNDLIARYAMPRIQSSTSKRNTILLDEKCILSVKIKDCDTATRCSMRIECRRAYSLNEMEINLRVRTDGTVYSRDPRSYIPISFEDVDPIDIDVAIPSFRKKCQISYDGGTYISRLEIGNSHKKFVTTYSMDITNIDNIVFAKYISLNYEIHPSIIIPCVIGRQNALKYLTI
jgi:hypothetical protein